MTTHKKKIEIQTRDAQGFTAVIRPGSERICRVCNAPKFAHDAFCPESNEPLITDPKARENICLTCDTEIAPDDNFCSHCDSQIPEDLMGAYITCRTQNGKLLALQGMVDHLVRLKEGPVPVPGLVGPDLLADIIVFLDQVRSDCLAAGADAAPHTVKHINKLLSRIEEATR